MWIGQATIWHPRKNKASPSQWKSPLRKRRGTENKLKARQTNQKADFPFSTFLEEEGREVPYGQKPALPLDFQLKPEAQGKDSSSPPVRRDCKHNKVSCRKTSRIVIWDCLISHTAFAHADGWRQNMTLSYIITPNTMFFFARGEQERANVLHEMWGMGLWWRHDVTAAIKVDVLHYHLCWGGSLDLGLHQVLEKGTLE